MAVIERAELKTIADRYIEAWQRRDPRSLALHHATDGIVESPMFATLRGRKAVDDSYRAFFKSFPDASLDVEHVLADPPYLVLFATINATHKNDFFGLPGTNRRIDFRIARLMKLNDEGLIELEQRIYDFTGVLVQVGLLRAKPAKP